jgi:hypothetical protein
MRAFGAAKPAFALLWRQSCELSVARVTVTDMAEISRCPVCCEHGVSNEAWCEWCDEALEFGTSEFIVTQDDLALPCVHHDKATATKAS